MYNARGCNAHNLIAIDSYPVATGSTLVVIGSLRVASRSSLVEIGSYRLLRASMAGEASARGERVRELGI
jgi:hypothetical protein